MLPVSQSSAVRDLLESIGKDGGRKGKNGGSKGAGKKAAQKVESVPLDEANLKCKLCGKCQM